MIPNQMRYIEWSNVLYSHWGKDTYAISQLMTAKTDRDSMHDDESFNSIKKQRSKDVRIREDFYKVIFEYKIGLVL